MIVSFAVGIARRSLLWVALSLSLATCGDDKPWECQKPAECIGKPVANTCKEISGRGRCVYGCAVVSGNDSCPPTYHCTGTADDGTLYCQP
jgi:hypothetical protein